MSTERFLLSAAVYLLLIKNGKILLARRYNTGWMDGKYSLIAGHLDGNESVTTSMIREAWEEAGIKISKKDLNPVTVLHRQSTDREYMDFFFTASKWRGKPSIQEPNKCDDMSWFPLNNLPDNLLPHIIEALKNFDSKIPFSESGWS